MTVLNDPVRHLASRLDRLLLTVVRPDGEMWTHVQLAEAMTARGITTTASYISHLRVGRRTNPPSRTLGVLSELLEVPAGYFYDDPQMEELDRHVALLQAVRKAGLEQVISLTTRLTAEQVDALVTLLTGLSGAQDGRPASPSSD